MGRLRRFPDSRFVGLRDEMRVYDCDDEAQFAALSLRVEGDDLIARSLVASFSPDTLPEARNRGFRPR
ncbi:MAG: hypothetical protein H6Q11_56 [Acidobacteria bacterium]|nr:hypothetical protein [Acidobacteriota bacterium]